MKAKADLITQIARDYYLAQLTLGQISQKYQISRYLITKYLKQAREQGIVQINIQAPIARNWTLESKISHKFALDNVFIIKDADCLGDSQQNLLTFAAETIQTQIAACHVVTMSWGETVAQVISKFQTHVQEDLLFVPLMGQSLKSESFAGATPLSQKAAAKYHSAYYTLPAPLYLLNDTTRQQLALEPALHAPLAALNQAEFLFTGLGTAASFHNVPLWQQYQREIFPDVDFQQVAGLLFGRPYDLQGHILNKQHDKAFGASIDQIQHIPQRLAIVQSKFKVNALLGALRGHLLTEVIMTEAVAQRVLAVG